MKKTPFLSYILVALLACTGIPQTQASTFYLTGDDTYHMNGRDTYGVYLSVTGQGNCLMSGVFRGGGMIENGELMLYWAKIYPVAYEWWTMGDNSRLDLDGSDAELPSFIFTGQSIVLDNGTVTLPGQSISSDCYTMGESISGSAVILLEPQSKLNLNGKTISNPVVLENGMDAYISTGGIGGTLAGGVTGSGYLTKVDDGALYMQGKVSLQQLYVERGDVFITGTANTKADIDSLVAWQNSTVTLVHTNANLGYNAEAYKGNLVIGEGSIVNAQRANGWDYNSSNYLTIQDGGKLHLHNMNYTISPNNKITLASGEIASDGIGGFLDFCGGANEVSVRGNSTLSACIRVRGGDSVAFNVMKDQQLTFSGQIVSYGEYNDDRGTIYKKGLGTLVMSGSSQMSHGSIIVQEGTLGIAGDTDALGGTTVNLQGNVTLDMGGRYQNFGLTVSGTGNTLKNGAFLGTIIVEKNSSLVANNSLVSWGGPTSLILNDGSKLEMSGSDPWINRLPALQVNGEAIINGAFLRVRSAITPDWEYTLTEGVAKLKGRGTYYVLTGDDGKDYFNLGGHTTNFDIIVWEADNRADIVIKNGKINTNVNMYGTSTSRPYNKLKLENVTLEGGASFSLGNGTELDLGGAQGTAWLTLADGTSAKVKNGQRVGLPGAGNGQNAMDYTLDFENGRPSALVGNGFTLNLEEVVAFETKPKTRFLVSRSCIGNPSKLVKIDVRADGQFILGNSLNESGEYAINTIYGDVAVSHTGGNLSSGVTYDVDVAYRVMGDVTAAMNGGKINAGIIGYEDASGSTTKGGTLTVTGASVVSVTSFIGKSMSLQSSGPVTLIGNARAFGTGGNDRGALTVGGVNGTAPDINFQSNLSGGTITLTGRNISGTGSYGDVNSGATFVDFADICTINASGAIGINEGFKGGALTVTGGGNVVLDLLGKEGATLSSAKITSQNNSVSMRSFTGGSLNATAKEAVSISGNVAATGNVELSGDAVSIGGSLSASAGSAYIKSTAGNIEITGTLSVRDSSTLESAKGITIGGNVTGGALTATAAQSIQLKDIGIGTKDAVLTATNGSITAGAITSGRLEASAAGAVTFNGAVAASTGNVAITGSSVGIQGALSANNASTNITSTVGSISIGGDLSAGVSSTLDSAANITVGGNVTGGDLTAKAAQSIQLKNIGIGTKDAVLTSTNDSIKAGNFIGGDLTATAGTTITLGNIGSTGQAAGVAVLKASGGSITASSFNGASLKATATGAVTINGSVASSGNVELTGASVGIDGALAANAAKNTITSTAGNIEIAGTLSAKDSSTLASAANITLEGNVTGGALTATAAQSIQLKDIGIGDKVAALTATGGSITAGAFSGAALTAEAAGAVTFNGDVASTGNTDLTGASVSIKGSIASVEAEIQSTGGDIAIDGTLSAAVSSTLNSAANITVDGDVTGGALTATAGQAIQLKDISIGTKNAELTATGSSITAGNVTAGMLTAGAAGAITMADVKASQTGSSIVSSGDNVALNSFSGAGAQIKASQGSVTVASSVSGAAANAKNTFTAAGSVSFNGATGVNNLSHAVINAPQVDWSNGTTLADVTVSHWAPQPAKSPRLLLAAAGTGSAATVNVNGFLTLTENSTVNGNVVINKQDNVEPIVTVDHSTITGQVSGATKLVLDSGSVGSAARGETETLTVVSSGTSAITALTDGQPIDNLTMNGGSLTVTNRNGSTGQVLVTELTVTENSALNSDMELQASGEATLTFDHLTAANETTAVLTMDGELTSNAEGSSHGGNVSNITIWLSGNDDVEGGKKYALISLINREEIGTPDFWDNVDLTPHVQFNAKATDENFFWEGNTLYYQNGGELEAAIWAPTQKSRQWNTADKNWLQDDVRYRYKDGVTTVFDDTAFNLLEGYEGDVHLESAYAPKKVQVNNSAGHNYTFMGSGAIDGTTTTLTKEGAGTLTITNANTYSGGTIIMQGTLEVAHAGALGSGGVTLDGGTLRLNYSGQTASFGTVTLQGGTVQIANGSKSFDLVVTGTDARMEGDYFNAFIGSLTLEAGSHLVSAGSLAGWDGPTSILMKNGSMLEMDPNCDIWINDITNLAVEGEATMFNAFLRINPYTNGGKYMLGNGVENLKGEGVTAYCLDGSTFDLNNHTTNLNIIVWNAQDEKKNVVEYGKVDTKVDIHDASRLYLGSDVVIGDRATFFMGDTAYLNLGDCSSMKARLNVFSFTGASATIDNGTLLVEKTKDGSPLLLDTNLRGEGTYVALRQESTLDLNRHSLAVEAVKLDADAAAATIGNGTVASGVVVDAGKALHLGAALNVTGAVSGSGSLVKNDDGSTATITGSMKDFKGNVEVQGGTLNLMNMAEAAQLNEVDIAINSGTLGVYKGGTAAAANEGTLTISNGHTLTAGQEALLNADLVMGGGAEGAAVLDVSATEGMGLQMGSTVTLNPGLVLLSANDMAAVNGLRYMGKYDLFRGVDGLSLDGTSDFLSELGMADKWVKAAEVFANDLFQEAEDQYYVFYSGATQAGGAGGNVGTVYIMQVPEPTTSTLSLLALAALAARRRK